MNYKATKFNSVIRLADGACIPFDEGNTDYQRYLKDVAEGATIEPAESAEEIKAGRKQNIDAERDTLLNAGVQWDGSTWHTDVNFQIHLNAFISAYASGILPAGASINVRTMDNQIRSLTRAQVTQLAGTVMQYVQTVFAQSWAEKDAL